MSKFLKTKPPTYPEGEVCEVELNSFRNNTDLKYRGHPSNVPLQEPTNKPRINPKLLRARDSIFVAKKSYKNTTDYDGDDSENMPNVKQPELDSFDTVEIKNKPKSARQVQFTSIPFAKNSHVNPAFVSDEDDGGDGDENELKDVHIQNSDHYSENEGKHTTNVKKDDNWSQDNYSDEETEPDIETPSWDTFKSIPMMDEDETLSSDWAKLFLKIFKVMSYGITFILVLLFGSLAKLLLHLMANMTKVNKAVDICKKDENGLEVSHYHSIHGLHSPERIQWIWMLYFVLICPDLLVFLSSLRICLFKQYELPRKSVIIMIFAANTAEVIGIGLFVYLVLPSLDVITGLIFTNSIFLLPSVCLVLSNSKSSFKKSIRVYLYALVVVVQVLSLISLPLLIWRHNSAFPPDKNILFKDNVGFVWAIPVSGILISIGYWENFITEKEPFSLFKPLIRAKQCPIVSKYAVYVFVSIWRCCLYLVLLIIIHGSIALSENDWKFASFSEMVNKLFTILPEAFRTHSIEIIRTNLQQKGNIESSVWTPVVVALIQVSSAFVCFQTVKFVCKICIQPIGFALPISLISPFSICLVNLLANLHSYDPCSFVNWNKGFNYIFWNVHYNIFDMDHWSNYLYILLWALTFVSQVIVTQHIWMSHEERLAKVNQLFVLPFYSSALVDQSIMLSRRVDKTFLEEEIEDDTKIKRKWFDTESINSNVEMEQNEENIKIYACATVWHESESELLQMLKSILRMDQDHCTRRLAVQWINVKPKQAEYYDFESHLFVDSAFDYNQKTNTIDINKYVKTMIDVVEKAARVVHQRFLKIRSPRVFFTPYGARLEWRLPGGTKLIAHLKDSLKIRHRKRWSQVMYMYYLIGYKIYEKEQDEEIRKKLTTNTFILALDGDINFRPEAVLLLVDLMRQNSKLGAACGRIHPVGVGPMAWYQKFEYAISHWLQKATEHVFGCVLCSPGCFSLFRGSALCDINVMNKYSTKPTEAIHYVQYDQGEDRWLCTLLLQQGWRVEYSAASDAYTHCPEGFDDFYIQRRRWAPSTMANIIDLLRSYKYTVRKNDNISSLYIFYQASLMLGTILSPGTIFLMLVGSINNSFGLKNEISFYLNFLPVFVFVLVCFFTKNNIQIIVAQILSTFYAMLMLAVLVSTAIQIYVDTIFSPSVVFFLGMIIIFVVSAIIHPQEFSCLYPAVIYMLTIPSMYLLLTIYSVINLNVVTWGTRETPTEKEPIPNLADARKNSTVWNEIGKYWNTSPKWRWNCLCCQTVDNDRELLFLQEMKQSLSRKEDENKVDSASTKPNQDTGYRGPKGKPEQKWVYDKRFYNSKKLSIRENEEYFWNKFIEKYLQPLPKNDEYQKQIKRDLIELRNKSFFAFGIINIIFVLFVYLMQLHKDIFSFNIVVSQTYNGTIYDKKLDKDIDVYENKEIQYDPVGLVLIIFFGSILVVQFIGMLMHRFGTLTHLLAFTDLNFFKVKEEDIHDEKLLDQSAVQIVRYLLSKSNKEEDPNNPEMLYFNMSKYFTTKYLNIKPNKNSVKDLKLRRKSTVKALINRRDTIFEQRRQSIAFLGQSNFNELLSEEEEHENESEIYNSSNELNKYEEDNASCRTCQSASSNESTSGSNNSETRMRHASKEFTQNVLRQASSRLLNETDMAYCGSEEDEEGNNKTNDED